MVNSGRFDGMPAAAAMTAILDWLEAERIGERSGTFRLRHCLLSRQRYWGAPIPIVHCESCGLVPVLDDQLPVVLPDIEEYRPKGQSPLAAAEEWVCVPCPACERTARR